MSEKGFLGSLFDAGNQSFITTKLASFVFVVGIVIAPGASVGSIISGSVCGTGRAIGALVFKPRCHHHLGQARSRYS